MDRIVSRSRLKSPESSSLKSNYRIPNTAYKNHSTSMTMQGAYPHLATSKPRNPREPWWDSDVNDVIIVNVVKQ